MIDMTAIIIDDDPAVRDSIRALLALSGIHAKEYESAKRFLMDCTTLAADCLIVDVRMPEMDGLALQQELIRRNIDLPVIVMTGHGDVELAVRAMKAGAIDFIEKPFDGDVLVDCVHQAFARKRQSSDHASALAMIKERMSTLTVREREVLEKLAAGRSNKIIAYELGISSRTVEIHRAHVMKKMHAQNLSELVRMAITIDIDSSA